MGSKVRQMQRNRTRTVKAPKEGELPPHTVTSVLLQAEVEFRDEEGRVVGRRLTDPVPVFEAQFFPGLVEFLRGKGLTVNTTKKEERDGPNQR